MKNETVHGASVPKIGFGTWNIGGGSYADPELDSASLAALSAALDAGYRTKDLLAAHGGDGVAVTLVGTKEMARVVGDRIGI